MGEKREKFNAIALKMGVYQSSLKLSYIGGQLLIGLPYPRPARQAADLFGFAASSMSTASASPRLASRLS
jgi:hypothetical protein